MTEILAALLGTIIGGLISWFANVSQNKASVTFNFQREFDSADMHLSRIRADQLIKRNPDLMLNEITEKYPEESFHIWQVIKFYRRLWVAIKYRQVKTQLIPDLFGEIFTGWYLYCFENQYLPAYQDSQGCKEIFSLKQWLDKHSSNSVMHQWKLSAAQEYELAPSLQEDKTLS